MRKFIYKILIYLVVFYGLLFGLERFTDHLLDSENTCNNNTWYQVYHGNIDAEVVILGNSRAEGNYNPKVINNYSGFSTYNLGLNGTPINQLLIRWNLYINHNKFPKILVLDVNYILMGEGKEIYDKFQYLPYTNTPEYGMVAKNLDAEYLWEKYIPMYKYRGYEMDVIRRLRNSEANCKDWYKGYHGNEVEWIEKDYLSLKKRMVSDTSSFQPANYSKGERALHEILAFCEQHSIKVLLAWSPDYYEFAPFRKDNKTYLNNLFTHLATTEGHVEYFNFSDDSISYSKDNFFNPVHLNSHGSSAYSKKIGVLLKSLYGREKAD